jgi:hypothetical protein
MASWANERVCRAAMGGDVAGIAAALLAGADPNAFEGTYGDTPLQLAAMQGRVAAIAALLAAGARVDGTDLDGSTPLIHAAIHGHTTAIDALLAAGADVHRVDWNVNTALLYASSNGHLDAARVLLEAGARTDVRNEEGRRPIDGVRMPLARLMRLRDRVTALRFHVAMRRFGQANLPTFAPCSTPLRPGPAAAPSPSPVTAWSGSGRRSGAGGGACVM